MELTLSELARRFENLIRIGTITHINHDTKPRVRVQMGELNTGWLQLATLRSGSTKTWNPPTVGEDVLVVAPSGDLESAIAILSINSQQNPAPCTDPNITRTIFKDGAQHDYDHEQHQYDITLPSAGQFTLTIGSTVITVTNDEAKIQCGQTFISLTDALAKIQIGSTTLDLSSSGTTLSTPQFSGVQS